MITPFRHQLPSRCKRVAGPLVESAAETSLDEQRRISGDIVSEPESPSEQQLVGQIPLNGALSCGFGLSVLLDLFSFLSYDYCDLAHFHLMNAQVLAQMARMRSRSPVGTPCPFTE